MTDEFIRSFDDVYLIYPLNNRFYDEPRGIFLPVRHMDYRINIAVSDPEYPHMKYANISGCLLSISLIVTIKRD